MGSPAGSLVLRTLIGCVRVRPVDSEVARLEVAGHRQRGINGAGGEAISSDVIDLERTGTRAPSGGPCVIRVLAASARRAAGRQRQQSR
jgi:hypothetical protein